MREGLILLFLVMRVMDFSGILEGGDFFCWYLSKVYSPRMSPSRRAEMTSWGVKEKVLASASVWVRSMRRLGMVLRLWRRWLAKMRMVSVVKGALEDFFKLAYRTRQGMVLF